MIILALRCSNTDFAYVVIKGSKQSPIVIDSNVIGFPKGYDEPALFYWFYQEIIGLIGKYHPTGVAIKAAEPMVRRSSPLETRIRVEGIALMAASKSGCATILRKVNPTIAKDLGMKGKSKYLTTKLDTSPITKFDSYDRKQQEAILVGWSCLE